MRIDIQNSNNRHPGLRFALWLVKQYIGMVPGPMWFMSYDPNFPGKQIVNYKRRKQSKTAPFANEEIELFSAFVSKLNSCRF